MRMNHRLLSCAGRAISQHATIPRPRPDLTQLARGNIASISSPRSNTSSFKDCRHSSNTTTMAMNFGSDNWAGAHPTIAQSLVTHATGYAKPYSESELDAAVVERFKSVFEHDDLTVYFVATGTAANSLALNCLAKPGAVVFAHRESHVVVDECGAPEYLSGGQVRLAQVDGLNGKMDPAKLRTEVARYAAYDVHGGRPVAISVTNPTESGTVYSLEELNEISAIAKEYKLTLHMDGARFANALAHLAASPAEATWRRGVDILSFGATKNGCWCGEAVLFFNSSQQGRSEDFPYIRKRAAQLFSKSRFISAQLDAYLKDELWLQIAQHSNRLCKRLGEVFASAGVRLVQQPQANELFVILNQKHAAQLEAKEIVFLEWPTPSTVSIKPDEVVCRFVTSFATTDAQVEEVAAVLSFLGTPNGHI
ncbi:threonine aldolase [Neohortaea acidophila]|uniref:Threonine aldolase n=1 Tax=Neohortaea acidophila TaxID=245834 RepID=A0A6A6PTU4_9PEZI|nr:threonine aldolase [Neohortaea acidophila]KAF2482637.1 threonine aldolase [Neohortaea acidophila]